MECENCIWKYDDGEEYCLYFIENTSYRTCKNYKLACDCGNAIADHEYKGKLYCRDCIKEK